MAAPDSVLDREELARARKLLSTPLSRPSVWPALAAAAFAACAALTLATAMILAPPVVLTHPLAEAE